MAPAQLPKDPLLPAHARMVRRLRFGALRRRQGPMPRCIRRHRRAGHDNGIPRDRDRAGVEVNIAIAVTTPRIRPPFQRIVSGGQTGADRAALDFAIAHGYSHGGWAPRGRRAEDGVIAPEYQLSELATGGYRQRTRRNVEDSDGTLIANVGELDGGTEATLEYARAVGKPHLLVQVDADDTASAAARLITWLRQHEIGTLNVAGPRESKRPGTYRRTLDLLEAVEAASRLT